MSLGTLPNLKNQLEYFNPLYGCGTPTQTHKSYQLSHESLAPFLGQFH